MAEKKSEAPRETIFVCGACGKTADKIRKKSSFMCIKEDFSDVSCYMNVNAILCYKDNLVYDDGRVVKAVPVNREDVGKKDA